MGVWLALNVIGSCGQIARPSCGALAPGHRRRSQGRYQFRLGSPHDKEPDARTPRSRNRAPRPRAGAWRARALPGSRYAGRDLRLAAAEGLRRALEAGTITGLGRRAKYLLPSSPHGDVLVMHLGMSGSFRVAGRVEDKRRPLLSRGAERTSAHDHVSSTCRRGRPSPINDPRRFGFMNSCARTSSSRSAHGALGPEPLGNAFDAALLADACAGKKTSLKAALSIRRVVAGLGNIYVCEALHRAHLSPKRRGVDASRPKSGAPNERAERLVEAIEAVLNDAIEAGRFVAARPSPTTASSAISSIISASTTARASPVRRRAAAAPSSASCRPAARPFIARCARSSLVSPPREEPTPPAGPSD